MPLPPASLSEALDRLRKGFCPDAASDVVLRYQLELSGESGGAIWLRVERGRLELGEGAAGGADVVFGLSAEDFFGVLGGSENPDLLFMAGRLQIDGALSDALLLRRLFRLSR